MSPLPRRPLFPTLRCFIGVLGLGGALAQTTPAPAPTPDPAPLALARSTFLNQVMADSQLLTEQYERALAKVEQELAEAGDYEEARLVQQRRAELKALYPQSDPSWAGTHVIPLLPQQAHYLGSAETRGDLITGWRTSGSGAEWTNVQLSPGRYYMDLEINLVELPSLPGTLVPGRTQPQESALFDFFEVSLLPAGSENRRSFEVKLSHDDTTFETLRIGPVNFTRSPVTLRLQAPSGYPGNQISIRNVRLVPVAVETTTVLSPQPQGPTLDSLKKSLNETLTSIQKPILDDYLSKIGQLSLQNPAVKEAVEAEVKRLTKLRGNSPGQASGALRLLGNHAGITGFEDLDGARYIADKNNRGDRFLIEHEGRRLFIRLQWILCAPMTGADRDGVRLFSRHFDIKTDVTPMGRVAQEFTSGYLTNKALRVLIRPNKNKDGSYNALVFLPDIGLYQNVLVSQGLAAVISPSERRGIVEGGLLESLLDLEEAARRQTPPPGAWSFTDAAP